MTFLPHKNDSVFMKVRIMRAAGLCRWRTCVTTFMACSLLTVAASAAWADVEPVVVKADQKEIWVGQRVAFSIELRSSGSFSGAASFDLPELPGAMVIKIGSPVVGSQQLEGESWFTQTHEFALFSQRAGTLKVPSFTVRFAERENFTGPVVDVLEKCPAFQIKIQRPPGSEQIEFLVTTDSLQLEEVWEPTPGAAEVGAVFKRTITQRAENLPGMALAPAADEAPDGVRVYPGQASTNDKLERGDFLGERRETVTYMVQKPGTVTLPELKYVWWNPQTKALESKTLPSVTFEVTALPVNQTEATEDAGRAWSWPILIFATLAFVAATMVILQWPTIEGWIRRRRERLNPPERMAARKLLRACHKHDAAEASAAWLQWSQLQGPQFVAEADLNAAVIGMQKVIFGSAAGMQWNGDKFAMAFNTQQHLQQTGRRILQDTSLPSLNPQS